MASKFFAGGESDEEKSVSQKSEHEEPEQEEKQQKQQQQKKQQVYFESSSEDEQKRTIKTEKEKRFQAIREVIKKLKDKIKIKDFVEIYNQFEELCKQMEKAKKVIDKEGVPLFYIRICIVLENLTKTLTADEKKKMSKNNQQSLKTFRQKITKNNKTYEKEIEEFKKDPKESSEEADDEDEDENEDDDDEEEENEQQQQGGSKFATAIADQDDGEEEEDQNNDDDQNQESDSDDDIFRKSDEEDEDDDLFDDDDEDLERLKESESSESEDEDQVDTNDPAIRRLRWLKKPEDLEKQKQELMKMQEDNAQDDIDKRQIALQVSEKRLLALVNKIDAGQKQKEKIVITQENIKKYLIEIVQNRTKKPQLMSEYLEILSQILQLVKTPLEKLEVILIILPIRFDHSKNVQSSYMMREFWLDSMENLEQFLKILIANDGEIQNNVVKTYIKDSPYIDKQNIYSVLTQTIDSLDGELYKGFKHLDGLSKDYAERMQDQMRLNIFSEQAMKFFEEKKNILNSTKVAFFRLSHLYYLHDSQLVKINELNKNQQLFDHKNSEELINKMAKLIYMHEEDKSKQIRASLYHIYHHSIHDRVTVARDLLLMSHIPENIINQDVSIQTQYNRVIAQIGLAYFRQGNIAECQQCLHEIISKQKIRELLAQGFSKFIANEQQERRRMLPYHLHLNVDLIESAYYISCMILEVPTLASEEVSYYKRVSNKLYRNLLDSYDKYYFQTVPVSNKDHIYQASQELLKSNWRQCNQIITKLNFWNSSPSYQKAKDIILLKIKESAVKCYILKYKNIFESLSLSNLQTIFEIDTTFIRTIICKMIINKEINAFFDQKNQFITFDNYAETKIQKLSQKLVDKLNATINLNEKIFNCKCGNFGAVEKEQQEQQEKQQYNKRNVVKKRPQAQQQKNRKHKRY